jgi:hypothetical protein
MQTTSVALLLAALLLLADSLPHCTSLFYQPAMQKTLQILAPTKYRHPLKIRQTIAAYLLTGVQSKKVKTKSDNHHCPISVYTLMTPKKEAIIEIHR